MSQYPAMNHSNSNAHKHKVKCVLQHLALRRDGVKITFCRVPCRATCCLLPHHKYIYIHQRSTTPSPKQHSSIQRVDHLFYRYGYVFGLIARMHECTTNVRVCVCLCGTCRMYAKHIQKHTYIGFHPIYPSIAQAYLHYIAIRSGMSECSTQCFVLALLRLMWNLLLLLLCMWAV